MRTHHLIIFFLSIILLISCKHDEPHVLGSIYGTVLDKATGEPIKNAGVELVPVGLKTITGDDGLFEFTLVEEGIYQLIITKSGYKEYTTNDIGVKGTSEGKPVNVQLEKLPPALQVVDDAQCNIDSIDFGEVEGDEMRSFNIFNNGEESLEWAIVYKSNWIESFSKQEGILKAGSTQTIVITINRANLVDGENSTVVHIVSDNGNKQITILATSVSLVETLAISEITPHSAVLNGKINKKSFTPIMEYGFVYGAQPTPSLDNGASKVIVKGTAQIGNFSSAISELIEGETYFVRAFAATETDYYYGSTYSFIAQEIPYVTLLSTYLMVQKTDLGYVDWYSAKTMCESSIVGGFTDWRMPTTEELMVLYNNKDDIGGFDGHEIPGYARSIDFSYWSSDTRTGAGWTFGFYIDFYSGYIDNDYIAGTQTIHAHNVRAVRNF